MLRTRALMNTAQTVLRQLSCQISQDGVMFVLGMQRHRMNDATQPSLRDTASECTKPTFTLRRGVRTRQIGFHLEMWCPSRQIGSHAAVRRPNAPNRPALRDMASVCGIPTIALRSGWVRHEC